MSFGFGVGDFLAVVELATKIRKRFVDAPAHWKAVSDEVKSLSSLIQDVEVDITNRDMTTDRLDRLDTIISGAKSVLEDLNAFLEKNRSISEKARANPKRIWSRFSLDSGDVRDLRARLTTHVTLLSTFLDHDLRDTISKVHEHMNEEDRQRILDWVSKEDHSALQANLLRRRQPGTRKWLLESEEWATWTSSQGLTLYCPGIPGAGKTFTTAMVIERLQQMTKDQSSIALSYAFCDYKRCEEHGVEVNLMRLLLRGVLEQCSLPTEIRRLYKSSAATRQELELDDTVELLRLVSAQKRRIFLVVDALDELQRDQREMLVQQLLDLQEDFGFNLFFTSRKMGDIYELFSPKTITVEIFATKEDVYSYLSSQMKLLPAVVRKNKQLQEEIQQAIVEAVEGMFLLAELHFSSLRGKLTAGAIRKTLAELSNGSSGVSRAYEQAYTMAMARIQEQDAEALAMAKRALLVLSHARRPFHSSELCHALGIQDETTAFDEEDVPDIGDVLSLCAGLVIHQTETDIVELAHKSTKEYFESSACKWFPDAEEVMFRLCVTYKDSFEKSPARRASPEDFPFLDYSRKHYGDHGIALEKSRLGVEAAGVQIAKTNGTRHQPGHKILARTTPQLLQLGLIHMTKELEGMKSSLVWASGHRKHNIARMLLSSNLSEVVDQIDEALEAAVRVGDFDIASMLLEFGANPMYRTRVRIASNRYLAKVRNALDLEKEHLDPTNQEFLDYPVLNSALPVAAFYGHSSCVRLLLDWFQDDTNTEDYDGVKINSNAAVLSAIAGGQYHLISELLPMTGPSTTVFGVLDYIPNFHLACKWGDQVAAMAILSHGVEPNSRDSRGRTPLAWATQNEMIDVVRYLLEHTSTDPNTRDGYGETPLSLACILGNLDLVKILMGAETLDIHVLDEEKRSAVSHAASHGNDAVLRLLLARDDVEPDIADKNGRTPLIWTITEKRVETMKLLLEHPKVTSYLDKHYLPRDSPLYFAVVHDNLDALQIFLGENISHPRQNLGNLHTTNRLFVHAMSCSAWASLPMLASRALKDLQDRSARYTAEENKNWFLHRIIAGDDHESRVRSSKVPITVWEALAKDPAFTGPVHRSKCTCDKEPLHLAILTGDVCQLKGLLLLDPELLERTWDVTGINPVDFVLRNLGSHAGRYIIEFLGEKNPEASYLILPQLLQNPNFGTTWHRLLYSTPKNTIDSRMLLDGFGVEKSPLWCTAYHGGLFRACLAATKKETFFVAFHRHETQPGPPLMVFLYENKRWPRLLELYDHCPALVRETARLGAEYSIDRADESGDTLFILAIRKRSVPTLKAMLTLKDVEKVVDKPHPYGWTPLALGVMTTNLEICELLSSHPTVDPNFQDDEGLAPLHHAVHQAYKWCHRSVWKRTDLEWLRQCVGIIELLYLRSDAKANLKANNKPEMDYEAKEEKTVANMSNGVVSLLLGGSEADGEKTATNMAKDLVSFLLGGSCADLDAKNHGDPDPILCLVSILNFLVALPEEEAKDKRWCKDEQVVEV